MRSAGQLAGIAAQAATEFDTDVLLGLKCDPPLAEQLREVHAAVIQGSHVNKRH